MAGGPLRRIYAGDIAHIHQVDRMKGSIKVIPPLIAGLALSASAQEPLRVEGVPLEGALLQENLKIAGLKDPGKPLEESDPAAAAVKAWQENVDKEHRKQSITAKFRGQWLLESEDLKAWFPDYRFIITEWSQAPLPGEMWKVGEGLAARLGVTLVCNAKGELVKEMLHWGNLEIFGEMLRDAKVSLRSPEDAGRIWKAFCDVHQMDDRRECPAEKIDDQTWRLGNLKTKITHFFYLVKLDEKGLVSAAEMEAEYIPQEE